MKEQDILAILYIVPEEEIYLRVHKDNPTSLHVMLNNGGSIHHEDEQSYYVRIKKSSLDE